MAGCVDQRAGDRDALLLAAGQLAGPVADPVGQPEHVDHGLVAVAVDVAAGELEGEQDVLAGGEHRQQVEGLEDEADVVATEDREGCVVESFERHPGDADGPGGRLVEAGKAVHQRGLAGAGGAHDRGEPAGRQVEVDAAEGVHLGVAAAVGLGQAAGARGGSDTGLKESSRA